MKILHGSTINIIRFLLQDTFGNRLTGLNYESSGLVISTIANNEAIAINYTQSSDTIETIATLGTYVSPVTSKCRFKEVDATNQPGLYEYQFDDTRFAVNNAKSLVITVSGYSTLQTQSYEIEFDTNTPQTGDSYAVVNTLAGSISSILEDTGTTIPALIAAGAGGPGGGSGAISFIYTLTDADDGTPIDGAEVWVTPDAAGLNVIASGTTDTYGVARFMLDAGAVYLWRKKSGYNFTNPDTQTVS
jgi:hypothetical protein